MRIKRTVVIDQLSSSFKKRCDKGINAHIELDEEALVNSVLEYHGFFRSAGNGQASLDANDMLRVNDWVTIKEKGPQL
jgi:hypothetical protein